MREITKEVTHTEIIGYEADDGTRFSTEEQCKRYESSAKYACKRAFEAIAGECHNGTDYHEILCIGYEDEIYVVDVKDAETLRVINMYLDALTDTNTFMKPEKIGQKVAISIWDHNAGAILGTRAEMESEFKLYLDRLFGSETEGTSE